MKLLRTALLLFITLIMSAVLNAGENLIVDSSFELTQPPDQFGRLFVKWEGWKYEGESEFAIGLIGHSNKSSALLIGKSSPKIRIWQEQELNPGRYRVTAYLRGLDIGQGVWNQTTEFMFNGQYMQLNKNGTFGWTKLVFVAEVKEKKKVSVSFGLMAPGYLWIDDVTLEKVEEDVPLTIKPLLGTEEASIAPPGELDKKPIICPFCGYKNNHDWKTCYACGSPLEAKSISTPKEATKIIASFTENNPFSGGTLSEVSFFEDKKALRIDKSYVSLDKLQDWSGYDYLNIELFSQVKEPTPLNIEIRDKATKDYWTRVNYATIVPVGKSKLVIPIKQLYVGEKSRPGRMLNLNDITNFFINVGTPTGPLYLGKLWLERDELAPKIQFDGLYAFDFGTGSSPLMEGFTAITPATIYSKGRGYGLKDAKIWRAENVLQPDPLYQDYLCIESGGLTVDLPNGIYHVFVNIDNPSGYWGEYQVYKDRAIFAQGKQMVYETMDFNQLKNKYYRYWNTEDLPSDNTFEKYQKAYFQEKSFDVAVTNGQLNLEFKGENMANSVSTVIVYPLSKAKEGEQFLKWVEDKRRFYFDNYFKRSLHISTGEPLKPTEKEKKQGYIWFHRSIMTDLYYNDTPFKNEIDEKFNADSFAGLIEPLTISVLPLQDLGQVSLEVSDLKGPEGLISANAIDLGYVSYRLSRVTMEGSVYTISPRIIIPSNSLKMPKDIARRFWLSIKIPQDTKPGLYQGMVTLKPENGESGSIPIELRVRKGKLDPVDIPVGPFGYTINTPWVGNDEKAKAFDDEMALKSMIKLREYDFTMFSGVPTIFYKIEEGKQFLDFKLADAQMRIAKRLGFLAVNTYGGGLQGLNTYYQDSDQMKLAGFADYSAFIQNLFQTIQNHATKEQWLPIYWNLADEPLGDDVNRAIENVSAYKKAFPKGPPYFTGASSFKGKDVNDAHFKLNKSFHVASLNEHDEEAIHLLHENGTDWAFYNGGNRFTFGEYLYKGVKQFNMKFRISWHWNISAGDPYYALDSREDDYAWFHASPNGHLLPEVSFERIAMGLVDYRMLLTLQRLINENKDSDEAKKAQQFMDSRLKAFKLGQRDYEMLYPTEDWILFRQKMADSIEALWSDK